MDNIEKKKLLNKGQEYMNKMGEPLLVSRRRMIEVIQGAGVASPARALEAYLYGQLRLLRGNWITYPRPNFR